MQHAQSSLADLQDIDAEDCSKLHGQSSEVSAWLDSEKIESLRNRFVTGDWLEYERRRRGEEDGSDSADGTTNDDTDEVYGDFEDLETGEQHAGGSGTPQVDTEPSEKLNKESEEQQERRLKKLALRAKFDEQYTGDVDTLSGEKDYFDQVWFLCLHLCSVSNTCLSSGSAFGIVVGKLSSFR